MQLEGMSHTEPEDTQKDEWASLEHILQVGDETPLVRESVEQVQGQDDEWPEPLEAMDFLNDNYFITDIFLNASYQHEPGVKKKTSSRRCLIDTGADMNIITKSAILGLQAHVRPSAGYLSGAGGRAEIIGRTELSWHLKRGVDPFRCRNLNRSATFVVVDPTVPYRFDCVLGRPWIQQNLHVVIWVLLKRYFRTQVSKVSYIAQQRPIWRIFERVT